MSVILQTSLGDMKLCLYTKERPNTTLNFLKLCKVKYYNNLTFYHVDRNFIAQTGDPEETGRGGASIFAKLFGDQARYFDIEKKPLLKHKEVGTLSMANNGNNMLGSQFFLTLGEDLDYLDDKHCVFGKVIDGFDVLMKFNDAICDEEKRPYQDIIIMHTIILEDPFDDPSGLEIPDKSPELETNQQRRTRIGAFEKIDDDEGKTIEEIEESIKDKEAKARATILEMVGDIPDADVKPPDNVLFVCKLNPVTTSQDLETIFSRFGNILSCEVIKDQKTGDSLQYAFIEFEKPENCEDAYFKMNNVIIDDRRIHVDFSQSVSKLKYRRSNKPSTKSDNDNSIKVGELTFENEEVGKAIKDVLKEKNRNRENWRKKDEHDSLESKRNKSQFYHSKRPYSESRNERHSPMKAQYSQREKKHSRNSSPQERNWHYSSSPNRYEKDRSPSKDFKKERLNYYKRPRSPSPNTNKKTDKERGRSPKITHYLKDLKESNSRKHSSSSDSSRHLVRQKRKHHDRNSSSSPDNKKLVLTQRSKSSRHYKDKSSSPETFESSKKHLLYSNEISKRHIDNAKRHAYSSSSDDEKPHKSSKPQPKQKHPKEESSDLSDYERSKKKKLKKHKKKKNKKHKKHSKKKRSTSTSSSSS